MARWAGVISAACTAVVEKGFYVLVILLPLLFTPLTRELFEFPKMILVYSLTIILLAAALVRSVITGRTLRRRTPLDLPLFFFLLSYGFSTVFSLDRYTSLLGYYTRFNGGLLSVLCFLTLFYLFGLEFTGSERRIGVVLRLTLLAAFFVSLYAIGQHFGLDKDFWIQDSQARAFSTLGQPNWLAAYLTMVLPLSLAMVLKSSLNLKSPITIYYLLITVSAYAALWFTYSLSGFLSLGFSLFLFFLLLGREKVRKSWRPLALFLLIALFISFSQPGIFGPRVRNLFKQVHLPVAAAVEEGAPAPSSGYKGDTLKIRLLVWQGALNLVFSSPRLFLLGSGPETFAYAFLPFRPKEMNLTSEWDFLYNKAHNDYLDIFVTRGALGLAAYFWLVVNFSLWVLRKLKEGSRHTPLFAAAFSGWVGLLVSNFFGWSTVSTSFLFWLYPALLFALDRS